MAQPPAPSGKDLLKHFDAEIAKRLSTLLGAGTITPEHIKELIRLTAAVPEYRDPEEFDSLLEDVEEMDASAFKAWVDQLIQDERS